MSDLTRRVESVSQYVLWVLFSLVYAFALWFIGFFLANEGWIAGFTVAQLALILLPILGVARALGQRSAASVALWIFAIGMLVLDALLVVISLNPSKDDRFGSFNYAPTLTTVWILLWIAPQIFATKRLIRFRSAPAHREDEEAFARNPDC